MVIHRTVLLAALLFTVCADGARGNAAQDQDKDQLPPNYVPTGAQIFKQYCAACHGADAKGHGPVGRVLRRPAPDLTTLVKRHGGKFPSAYVTGMLSFAPGVRSHGSGDMPTWGALFEYYYDKKSAQQRIQNVSDYLESLQEK
jgi:mono/diheme cytochrome c family protein